MGTLENLGVSQIMKGPSAGLNALVLYSMLEDFKYGSEL